MRSKELPKRKHPRLKEYDYSQNGCYFVTICTEKRVQILSKIVGRGLAPAEREYDVRLTRYGEIAKQQLFDLEKRFENVVVDYYCIMPNHIHAIIMINETAAASHRPTLNDVVCSFKSMATRLINKSDNIVGRKVFQSSYYEHIIRNERDLFEIRKYIENNPIKWETDEYYIKQRI